MSAWGVFVVASLRSGKREREERERNTPRKEERKNGKKKVLSALKQRDIELRATKMQHRGCGSKKNNFLRNISPPFPRHNGPGRVFARTGTDHAESLLADAPLSL